MPISPRGTPSARWVGSLKAGEDPVQTADHINEIQRIAGFWKNQDPQMFERFLRHFDAWTFDVTVAVTEAPPAEILTCQGRAQSMRKVMQTFAEALDTNTATP